MKSLQAQDGDTRQLLPEAQPEGWPAGRTAGNGAVLRSLPRGVMLLEPTACTSTGN